MNALKRQWGVVVLILLFALFTFPAFLQRPLGAADLQYLEIVHLHVRDIIFTNYGDQLPLWFLIAKTFTLIFGESMIALRAFPIIFFVLSAFIVSKLAELYKVDRYIATALFLAHPLLWNDTMYLFKHWSFFLLLCLSTLYFFELYIQNPKRISLTFFILCIIVGLFSSMMFAIFLSTFFIYVICKVVYQKVSKKFLYLLISVSVMCVLPVIYLLKNAKTQLLVMQSPEVAYDHAHIAEKGIDLFLATIGEITGANYLAQYPVLVSLLAGGCVILLVNTFIQKGNCTTKYWLLFATFFSVIFLMIVASYTQVRFRYINFAVPFFYLAILPRSQKIWSASIACVLVCVTLFSSYTSLTSGPVSGWMCFSAPQKNEEEFIIEFNDIVLHKNTLIISGMFKNDPRDELTLNSYVNGALIHTITHSGEKKYQTAFIDSSLFQGKTVNAKIGVKTNFDSAKRICMDTYTTMDDRIVDVST